jgi:CRP-like cAMP-binding protein
MPPISSEHSRLIRQLETIAELSAADKAVLAALPLRLKSIRENRDIVREGDRPAECCLILKGLVCRAKMVAGGRRQILSFHFPGDLADLQSLNLGIMDHSLTALTPTQVAFITHDAIRAAINASAGVREAFVTHAMVDGAIFREWIANVGRRTATERIAHIFCECFVRMRALGLVSEETFELALTQADLADAAGLSNVHVNRTLQELRRLGVIKTTGKMHAILNWDLLQEIGDFNPAYLHLKASARRPVEASLL